MTRRDVLEHLAAVSEGEGRETTTVSAMADVLEADRSLIHAHLSGLAACDLVRKHGDERVRVTITGEQLLALETEEVVIVTSPRSGRED